MERGKLDSSRDRECKLVRAHILYKGLTAKLSCLLAGSQGASFRRNNLQHEQKCLSLKWRAHIVDCYITGESVDWGKAYWLTEDEVFWRGIEGEWLYGEQVSDSPKSDIMSKVKRVLSNMRKRDKEVL